MNKLSELSKPVAWEVKGILCHSEEEAQVYVGEPESLYSQEYVSALLAELEAKDKRIAELENDLGLKHIRAVEEALIFATDRNSELEAKLATPVRLGAGVLMFSAYSANSCDSEWHLCLARDSVVSAIRAAGFTVGDE